MVKSQKKIQREIFFEINVFGIKYVLKHSESIKKSKFVVENFHFLAIFVKI